MQAFVLACMVIVLAAISIHLRRIADVLEALT